MSADQPLPKVVRELVEGLAGQQAMPDDSYKVELATILDRLRILEAATQQERARLDEASALLEELRINANRLCDRQHGGTYEADCRRTLRKVDDYQKAEYRAGRGRQRAVVASHPPPTLDGK